MTDHNGGVILAKDYQPYGEMLDSAGSAAVAYDFVGEWTDSSRLLY